jgi:hypothetical protein
MKNFNLHPEAHTSQIHAMTIQMAEVFTQGEIVLLNGDRLQSEYKGKLFNATPQRAGTETQRKAHALQVIQKAIKRSI